MPGIQDWLNCPLDIIQGYFDPHDAHWTDKVNEYFKKKLDGDDSSLSIPSVNHRSLHQLKPNSLVRFRGMVQDMYDPEFYLGVYEVEDTSTGTKMLKSGRYQDVASCLPNQKINIESRNNVTMDRQTYYCIPVPGENVWVKEAFAEKDQILSSPCSSSTSIRGKRALDTDENKEKVTGESSSATEEMMDSSEDSARRTVLSSGSSSEASQGIGVLNPIDLNFPLQGENGTACLVKIYDEKDSCKLNDVVEIIGVLSVDPSLATFPESSTNGNHSDILNPEESMDGIEEQTAHSPPPSLVPRLHVIRVTKLQHINPLLPLQLNSSDSVVAEILRDAGKIRDQLRWLLQQLLLGDDLSADYLLLHLLSNVYARRDVSALGKWSLNISGCPKSEEYTHLVHSVLEQLVTKSHLLPLTLTNLNSSRFTPKKDYSANRLKSGVLQLTDRTHVILDETVMEAGQLDTNGVQNVTALGNAISWQKVDYDFDFHKTEFPINLKFLILSEGKSMLPSDCLVRLQKKEQFDIEKLKSTIQDAMTSGNINLRQLRCYVSVLENLDYDLTQDMQKIVEQDFVDVRKDNRDNMTQLDLHNLLILARLMSLSSGETRLKCSIWERVKRMENERKARLRAADS
ncbi:Mini-chromosome maintenance complex-binding protein [Holothuria leucospilota]|uniref:Mini-chromosome maintenance complex-binding protein n=1 Tax=Holothuria leucospilota TaxID=206669 RepID=A0A9Q0YSF8_HOLLE|nr:Mini-chromosome maintenance complex-binding protein [Holothuria leucospilota]